MFNIFKYFKIIIYPKTNKHWHFEFKITIPTGKTKGRKNGK